RPVPLLQTRLDRPGQRGWGRRLAAVRAAVEARPGAKRPRHHVAPGRLGKAVPGELPGHEALTRTLRSTAQRRPVPARWPRRGPRARWLRRRLRGGRRVSLRTTAACISRRLHRLLLL